MGISLGGVGEFLTGRRDGEINLRDGRRIAREVRGTVDEVARAQGTIESYGDRRDVERDRVRVQARRLKGQIIREDIRIMDMEDEYRARRGAYGEELPAPGALPPQGNGAAWGYEAPVSRTTSTQYAAAGAAGASLAATSGSASSAATGAATPSATSQAQAPKGRVMVTKELIESMSRPLEAALNARTPAERDAALDQYIAAVNRVGPYTEMVSAVTGAKLEFATPDGRGIHIPLPPKGQTFRPGDIAGPILQGNAELEQALRARVAVANGQAAPSQQPLAPQPPAPAGASQDQAGTKDASKVQNNPASTQTGTNQPDATAPSKPEESSKTETFALPAAGGERAKPVALRKQAPPPALQINREQVTAIQTFASKFPELRAIIATDKHEDGVDGLPGPKFYQLVKLIGGKAGISIDDLPKIKFGDTNDALYNQFAAELAKYGQQPAAAQAKQGPSAEELEAQRRAEAEARARAEQAQRLENDALTQEGKIPGDGALVLRGSAYDPRNLRDMPQADKRQLAIVGLHALDELKNDRGGRSNDTLHDKLAEAVRETNKKHGTNFTIPSESNPITDDALMAVGLLVAKRGGLSADVYRAAETQRQMDHAAAVGLHALDRTSGVIDVTSPDGQRRLRAEVKKFERDTELNADGIADRDMLRALEQAVAVRGGLTKVGGGTDVQTQGGEPPAAPTAQPGQTDRAPDTRGK